MLSENLHYFYLDSNAVTLLWDLWTSYKKEGQTGDDIQKSPFNRIVLSDYTLDECLTIPHTNNAYKKHLCMISIFPEIKVLKPITLFDGKKDEQDTSSLNDLLRGKDFLAGVASLRASALVTSEGQISLGKDIDNKDHGKVTAKLFSQYEQKLDSNQRIEMKEVISKIIREQNISPKYSKYDFYQLCMYLYVAKRKQMIKGLKYKKSDKNLNEQIDSYHLSYLPYVGGFITDDREMSRIANSLSTYFGLGVQVLDSAAYWHLWLKSQLKGIG